MNMCHREFVNDRVPPNFLKWPCATGNLKWQCATGNFEMTMCHREFEVTMCHRKFLITVCRQKVPCWWKTVHFSWIFMKLCIILHDKNTFGKRTTFWKWKLIPRPILKWKHVFRKVKSDSSLIWNDCVPQGICKWAFATENLKWLRGTENLK